MLRYLIKKDDRMQEQMSKVNREMETLRKNWNKMLEIKKKKNIIEINVIDRFIREWT